MPDLVALAALVLAGIWGAVATSRILQAEIDAYRARKLAGWIAAQAMNRLTENIGKALLPVFEDLSRVMKETSEAFEEWGRSAMNGPTDV